MSYEIEVRQNKLGGDVGEDGALNIIAKGSDGRWVFQITVDPKPTDATAWNNDSAILRCFWPSGAEAFSGNIWSLTAFAEYVQAALVERNRERPAEHEEKP